MKYYIVKYTDNLPARFCGITQGPLIKIRPQYEGDVGLLEHEQTHVRQWYVLMGLGLTITAVLILLVSPAFWPTGMAAPFHHSLMYKYVRPYRKWCEVQAYRKQISTGSYIDKEFAATALVEKYGLGLNINEADSALFD